MTLASELVEKLGMSYADVARVVLSAPARYYVFRIAKRTSGFRTIAQPARELKAIQRYILKEKLSLFPVHPAATAYSQGCSIRDNAAAHVSSDIILKLDFSDFFPSFKTADWEKFARKYGTSIIDIKDLKSYSNLLFWGAVKNSKVPRCLSIGAPTSPSLSNIMLYAFDTFLYDLSVQLDVIYTRYADDITVSGKIERNILRFESNAAAYIKGLKSPKLSFNVEKRGLYRKAGKRLVTGLVLTPDRKISIGRERKRQISAMLHHLSLGNLDVEGKAILKGWLGFTISTEVEFIERLRMKYGDALIDKALKYHIASKGIRPPINGPFLDP